MSTPIQMRVQETDRHIMYLSLYFLVYVLKTKVFAPFFLRNN